MLVSRLVAMAWVDGYEPTLTVNHIDGNPSNNTPENLEWVTIGENVKKASEKGFLKSAVKMLHSYLQLVKFITLEH